MADFTGGPGFAAFVATFVMVVGVILLARSLTKHLRKVRTHPPEGEKADGRADAVAADAADASAGSDGSSPRSGDGTALERDADDDEQRS